MPTFFLNNLPFSLSLSLSLSLLSAFEGFQGLRHVVARLCP